MTLDSYLEANKISPTTFAEAIGTSRATVSRYMRGRRIPHRDHMRKIVEVTDGEVTPNDFYLEQEEKHLAEPEKAAA